MRESNFRGIDSSKTWMLTLFSKIILVASYDDAAFRLDADARSLLASLGSNISKTISFRDGWVFIGAKNLPSFPTKEAHIPNDKVFILI